MRDPITRAEVRASFSRKIRDQAAVMMIGRPIADSVTPYFYNNGWTANGVTYLCMALSFSAIGILLVSNPYLYVFSALLMYAVFVLDCVDGNLARLTNSASYYGKFMDGLSDGIYYFLAPFTVGLGLYLAGVPALWLLLGAIATSATLAGQMVRNRYSFFREWAIREKGPLTQDETARLVAAQRLEKFAGVVFVNCGFAGPVLLAIPYIGPKGFLIWSGLYHTACAFIFIAAAIWQGSIVLRRHRTSVRSASSN